MSVTWNGSEITNPILIYHDEIIADLHGRPYTIGDAFRPGALMCKSKTRARAAWRYTDSGFFNDTTIFTPENGFQQIRNLEDDVPSLSRLSRSNRGVSLSEPKYNGLWFCRVNVDNDEDDVRRNFVFVGLYSRGGDSGTKHYCNHEFCYN